MAKQVIQLNNKYTQKQKKRNLNPVPKRKHLGLILIVAILLFSLASMSLIKSYETLHSQVALEQSAKKFKDSKTKAAKSKTKTETKNHNYNNNYNKDRTPKVVTRYHNSFNEHFRKYSEDELEAKLLRVQNSKKAK